MRLVTFLLCVCISGHLINAQTYYKTIGGPLNDGLTSVLEYDGEIYMGGYTQATMTSQPDFYVAKLDLCGAIEWEVVVGTAPLDQISDLLVSGDYVYAVGKRGSTDNHDIYLIAIDKTSGIIAFEQFYGGITTNEFATSIVERPNGNLVIAGRSSDFVGTPGSKLMFLLEVDNLGTYVQSDIVGAGAGPTTPFSGVHDLLDLKKVAPFGPSNVEYITTGSRYQSTSGNRDIEINLFDNSFDNVGSLVIDVDLPGSTVARSDLARKTVVLGNKLFTVGNIRNSVSGKSDFFLLRVDGPSLTPDYIKVWGHKADDDVAIDITVHGNNLVVAGYTDNPNNNGGYDLFMVEFNQAGNPKWGKVYGTGDDEFFQNPNDFHNIVSTIKLGSGLILVGKTDGLSALNDDMLIVQTDEDGESDEGCLSAACNMDKDIAFDNIAIANYLYVNDGVSTAFDIGLTPVTTSEGDYPSHFIHCSPRLTDNLEQGTGRIEPNPSNGSFFVSNSEDGTIQIFSIGGALVFESKTVNREFIETGLEAGIYMYILNGKTGTSHGKLVIE